MSHGPFIQYCCRYSAASDAEVANRYVTTVARGAPSPVRRKDPNRWRELTVEGLGPNPPGNIAEESTEPVKHEIFMKDDDVLDFSSGALK